MAHQRAGEEGKPGIHISSDDAKRAQRMGMEEDSPSTVYTDALEAYEKFEKNREKDRKKKRKEIMSILQEHEEHYGTESREELEKVFL
jgi:endo-alpha-1,4-polygalactosaminidase (GH114 family)